MTACPSQELIAALLDERLPESELAAIVAHIEACLRCQSHLEEMTSGDVQTTTLREVARTSEPIGSASDRPTALDDNDATGEPTPAARNGEAADANDSAAGATACLTDDDQEADVDGTRPFLRFDVPSPKSESGDAAAGFPIVSGYEVLERLGQGGMGVVYKARDLGLNRLVALKMIRGGTQAKPEFFKRFSTEAEAIARLRHAHIIQIYDIGEADGLPYVALELLEGGGLDDSLAGTPQPAGVACELLVTLAGAIEIAHQAGIIHRDLKPSNVLYTSDGVPKITDFGLAKRIDSDDHQTESGQIMGSPSYMAPEQARGHSKEVGAAADVYALGAIFYEMLTGRPPFKGETPIETIRQVIDDEPVAPARLVPRLARDVETICLKCLHKEPAKRYPTARALAEDLERHLRREPILARPTPAWERAGKWARRRPWAAAAAAVCVIALLSVVGGVFAYQRNEFLWSLRKVQTGNLVIDQASRAKDRDPLTTAKTNLSNFLATVPAKPEFGNLRSRVGAELNRVESRIQDLLTTESRNARERKERAQFREFRDLRKQAQLYAVRQGVIEPADYRKMLGDSARAALEVYGEESQAPAAAWSLMSPLPESLNQSEKDEVRGGCFDLLLILSEAADPAEGLKILDRAARLRPDATAAYHLRRAAVLFESGDRAGRTREEGLAKKLQPATALDHLLIGREQLARGEFRDAIRSSQSALQLNPDQLGAHLVLAVAYFNSNRLSEAKVSLITCIQNAPQMVGLYLFRALVFGEEGSRALGAIKDMPALATELQLEAAEAFESAEGDYRRALELQPSADLRYVLLVNRGGMYYRAGRLDEGVADLEAAIVLNPRPYHAHAQVAQIYQQQGRLDQAALALDRAIERQSDHPELYRARALLVVRPIGNDGTKARTLTAAQRAPAVRDLQQAIRLAPGDSPQKADDYTELGRLFFGSGQVPEALAAYDNALRIAPLYLKALRLRTLALLEQERYDEVLAACDAFLAQGKPSADLLEVRGQARLARKDYGGAIGDYTVALSLNPDSATLRNRRGWAYLLSDAFKLALADFEAAILLDPALGHAYSGRGLARISLGGWRDALGDVDTAVRLATAGLKQQALYNAARVHALATRYAGENASRRGEADLALYRQLRERAHALLRESVRQLPPDQQSRFWRDVVASDPVLRNFVP